MKPEILLFLGATALVSANDHTEQSEHSGDHIRTGQKPTGTQDLVSTFSTSFSISMFDPSNAPNYNTHGPLFTTTGSGGAVVPIKPSRTPYTPTPEPSLEPDDSPSPTTPPASSGVTSAVAQESTGAARGQYPEILGAIAGGVFAGLALV